MSGSEVQVDTDSIDPSVKAVIAIGDHVAGIFTSTMNRIDGIGPVFANEADPMAKSFEESFWPDAHMALRGVLDTGEGLHKVGADLETYSQIYKTTEENNVSKVKRR
jgi:hypothetical protein